MNAEIAADAWRPSGLDLLLDFVAPDREEEVIAIAREAIEIGEGNHLRVRNAPQRRRYALLGYAYDYSKVAHGYSKVAHGAPLVWERPIPDSFAAIADRVRLTLAVSDAFDCVTVNEYAPGDGIHSHVDSPRFAELIAIVSVGEVCSYTFASKSASYTLVAPRCSLIVMRGVARYDCTHAVEVDPTLQRTRYSIVLRTRG